MQGIKFSYRFIPLRFSPSSDRYVGVVITVENRSDKKSLLSLELRIKNPNVSLGFDIAGASKKTTKNIGELLPGDKKEVLIKIFGTKSVPSGIYDVDIILYEHYLNYNQVIAKHKKEASLRVVA